MGDYVDVPSTDTDQDSPCKEDVMDQIRKNTSYNYGHAARCGTDAAGVRLAFARHEHTISESSASEDYYERSLYYYSSESEDGDPNFGETAVPIISIERTGGDAWDGANFGTLPVVVWIDQTGSLSCAMNIQFNNSAGADIQATVHVMAVGIVTDGE